jgi:hypothetical protein
MPEITKTDPTTLLIADRKVLGKMQYKKLKKKKSDN